MDFINVGKRCYKCYKLDFLPFECNMCGYNYCQNHRRDHECIETSKITYKNITCPFCFKKFILEENEDENVYINKHFNGTCSHFKEKCQKANCKEYKYLQYCSKCDKKFCLTHRHHDCISSFK